MKTVSQNRSNWGVALISIYCFLVGAGSIILAFQGSLIHWVIAPIAFTAAYGLWNLSSWALPVSIFLCVVEIIRAAVAMSAGNEGMIRIFLSLMIVLYLYMKLDESSVKRLLGELSDGN